MNKNDLGYKLHLKGKNAEAFVYELAKKSFLEDWCYKNPLMPNGKELCDLLIVFGDTAIIWQIKDLKLNERGKYKKSGVIKNLKQLTSAKHRLFNLKVPIELENPRRGKELFDPRPIKQIYLISALLGKGEEFFSFAEILKGDNLIHTFTRDFTELILNELDTIKDFVAYIKEKEKLIFSEKQITLFGGEEELLGLYLENERSFEAFSKSTLLLIQEGIWKHYQRRPEYKAKKKEDKISYLWDSILNRAYTCGPGYEAVAKELASTNRFERRILSKSFYGAHILANNEKEKNTFRRMFQTKGVTYCFVFLDEIRSREERRALLGNVCFVARGLIKENKKVIGIATEMKIRPMCSYDFCFLELPTWDYKVEKQLKIIQKKTKIFTNTNLQYINEDEYPKVTKK